MNKCQTILAALLTADEPLRAHVIAARTGLHPHDAGRSTHTLCLRGRVSKVKVKGIPGYRYYLTDAQRVMAAGKPDRSRPSPVLAEVSSIPTRIRFLQRLKGLPAFAGEAILDAMIGDYRRAQAAAVRMEDAE